MKRYILSFILMNLLILSLAGQDSPFQFKDSVVQYTFVKTLISNGLYQSAATEMERLVYNHPFNRVYFSELIKIHKIAGNSGIIRDKLRQYPFKTFEHVFDLYHSYVRSEEITESRYVFDHQLIEFTNSDQYQNLNIAQLFLESKPKLAHQHIENFQNVDNRLKNISVLYQNSSKKSPIIAGMMSAVIPTLGRHYARDHKDAVFSFIFMASTGFQAYRRFKSNGIGSPSGWAYAAVFGGFYTGNIYGSVKAAQRYNRLKYKTIYNATKSYFDLYYNSDF